MKLCRARRKADTESRVVDPIPIDRGALADPMSLNTGSEQLYQIDEPG